jgi:hypothetical protein
VLAYRYMIVNKRKARQMVSNADLQTLKRIDQATTCMRNICNGVLQNRRRYCNKSPHTKGSLVGSACDLRTSPQGRALKPMNVYHDLLTLCWLRCRHRIHQLHSSINLYDEIYRFSRRDSMFHILTVQCRDKSSADATQL